MDKIKIIILLIWFLDILWIGIFIPTLPDLAQYYWVSAHSISYAIVLYAFFSFFSSPILWQLSDKFWRRIVLIFCIIWTFVSSLIMSLSNIFIVFLLARIVNWFTGGNISVLQSMLSDISKTKEERMHNMWMIWALFWLGFIIWPVIWSFLLPFSIKAPFWFMTILAFIEMIIVILYLDETIKSKANKIIRLNPFWTILKYLKEDRVNLFISSFFILILSTSMYQWMFPVFLHAHFWIPWQVAWYIMSWVWLIVAFNQAFLLKKFWLKYFKLKNLFLLVNIWAFFLFLTLSFLTYFPAFLSTFYLLVLIFWLVAPIYSSEIVESTKEHDRWEIMWVLSSLQSVSMFIWPTIAWILIDKNISIFLWWAVILLLNLFFLGKIYKILK